MGYSIKYFHNEGDFDLLKNEWKQFEQSICHTNISTGFDWLQTWWEIFKDINNNEFGHQKQLLILCLYRDDQLIAIFPLVKLYRKYLFAKISFVEFLGQQWLATYMDFIGKDLKPNEIVYVFDWLKQNVRFDMLFLKYIPENSSNFKNSTLYPFAGCPELELIRYEGDEDYINKCYSKNLKQNLRTSRNKIKKNDSTFQEYTDSINDFSMVDVVNVSESKLTDGKTSKYQDPNKLQFIKVLGKKMDSNIAFIKINDRIVAYRLNFIFNKLKACVDASYSRDFRNFDLGSLSLNLNIKDSFDHKLVFHSEGPGLEFYKLKFIKSIKTINIFIKQGNHFYSGFLLLLLKQMVSRKSKKYLESASKIIVSD